MGMFRKTSREEIHAYILGISTGISVSAIVFSFVVFLTIR